ncbi:fatty acid-binding protein, liver-like [Leptodactylus fuscus]|uniref:fatty acid-binding protein, liver-like n=1 Tax=Leptodactylus fuscus TaxID=238119 RepID=UPI003F4E986F
MSFSGTFELQSQENYEPFMKASGIPADIIEKLKDVKSATKMEQNGNHFVVSVVTEGTTVLRNEFTIGEETDMNTITGDKVRTTVNLVDGKLVSQLKAATAVTEISGDILTTVITLNDIVYKSVSKRIA